MIPFSHIAFKGKECLFDSDFEPKMKLFGDKAHELGLIIWANSSFRSDSNHIKGAVVPPAKMSNHFVAHALDANLKEGDKMWSSKMLETPKSKVLELINYSKAIGLRWGGDFAKKDTIHWDDGLNIKNAALWHQKYNTLH